MPDVTTVPGVQTVHPRSAWVDPAYPITGPLADWGAIREGVAHYTAADDLIDGDPGEHAADLPAYLRAIQRDYVTNRGYSVGYWWAVDWLGGAWQMRGWEFRSAANAGRKITPGINDNAYTGPVLYLVDGADRLTAEAASTGRALYREMSRRAGRTIAPFPHSHYDYTACPGEGIRADIAAGLLDPGTITPTPPPAGDDDDMKIYAAKHTSGETVYIGDRMRRRALGGTDAWTDFQAMVKAGSMYHPVTGVVLTDPVNLPRLDKASLDNLVGLMEQTPTATTCRFEAAPTSFQTTTKVILEALD